MHCDLSMALADKKQILLTFVQIVYYFLWNCQVYTQYIIYNNENANYKFKTNIQ